MDDHPHVFVSNIFGLNTLRKKRVFCNVTLKVNEKEFYANHIVLVAFSPYFEALLTGDFAESKQSTIEIHGFEPEIVDLIIDFAYTNQITITRTNAIDLLTAADHFQILQLKSGVSDYLEKNICFSNCFEVIVAAGMLNCENLRETYKSYILRNFQKVCQEDNFLNLPYKLLIEVASDDDIIVEKEEMVFKAVFRWMDLKPNERKPHLDEVLETVRLDILCSDFLQNVVTNHPMLKESDKVQNQVKDILSSRYSRFISGIKPLATQSKHRKMVFDKRGLAMGIDKRIWFIASGNDITSYDFLLHQKGPKLPPMTYIKDLLALATNGECLFAIGFEYENNKKYYYCLEIFDVNSKVWSYVTEYSTARKIKSLMMVSHKGNLYIKDSDYEMMRTFNIEKRDYVGKVSFLITVKNKIYRGICSFDSYIYLFGERNEQSQRYNISANTWEMVDPIPLDDPLEIAVKDGKIFAKNKDEVMFYDNNKNRWFQCKLNASQIYDMNL